MELMSGRSLLLLSRCLETKEKPSKISGKDTSYYLGNSQRGKWFLGKKPSELVNLLVEFSQENIQALKLLEKC